MLILAIGLAFACMAASQSGKIPVYKAYRTAVPIIIDGKLNDPAWSKADLIDGFVNNSDGSPSP